MSDLFEAASQREELVGVVDRIVYSSPESGYTVAVLVPQNSRSEVTIVGALVGIQPQDEIRCVGEYVFDRKYGRQFKVHWFETRLPTSLEAIERYLGSGALRGIGPSYAQKLVKHFGQDVFDVLDNHPERLREVQGIGSKKAEQIRESWAKQRAVRDIMLFLHEHEISPSLAPKILAHYGSDAIRQLRQNPYQLAMDIRGIGFKRADAIARKLGIPPDSLERIKAGSYYFLHELAEEGHAYFPAEPFVEKAAEVLEVPPESVVQALNSLKEQRYVVLEKLPDGTGAVYLRSLHLHEVGAAQQLAAIVTTKKRIPSIPLRGEIKSFEAAYRFELAENQKLALETVLKGGVCVITGGPGTGKTTIVRTLLRILEKYGIRVVLAAPTGRAAKRMQELTHHHASTIHRLLQYSPREGRFLRNRLNPIRADFVVIDEASMVDISLAYHFLQAIEPRTSLVFVGDVDQLPSVGPGNFLHDIITSKCIPTVSLREIFRQAEHSLIVRNAHKINQGEMPTVFPEEERTDFKFLRADTPEEILSLVKDLVGRILPANLGLDPLADIQVLTPMHRGVIGAQNLNRELQAMLNPNGASVERGGTVFRVGDKVMQVTNNYDKEVFNGDIGIISTIDKNERFMAVRFDPRTVVYDFGELDQLELAYALTVHKSQGSEYPAVVIPMHFTHAVMLHRNLLYTAVTRGRRLVCVVGQWGAIRMAVQNAREVPRYSALGQRLQMFLQRREEL
ncbi:MAG: ATP-dependent RecD-like DNA helicase [Candidatus Sumerlaeaceae bacterium]|nr:ATP-dependent RecD-like DNA helicase [Candidatus Sumerlaeaceae bacterium]